MTEREVVLGLCDEVLGERGVRAATWPWLRSADGELAAVDSWWPGAAIAVLLVADPVAESRAGLLSILGTLDAHGVHALPMTHELWHDLDREEGLTWLADVLTTEAGRLRLRAPWQLPADSARWGFVFGVNVGPETELPDELWDDDDHWPDDDDGLIEDEEDEWEAEEPRDAPDLGWRTRPTLLALLGAIALARRAAALVDRELLDDDVDPELVMGVLGVVGLHADDAAQDHDGASLSGIAVALATSAPDVDRAADLLVRHALVHSSAR